jgi:hypothetical protein
MTVLGGGLFLIEVETAPNVWAECADLTRVTKSNNITISRTRVFRKTYRAEAATDYVYTLAGLLNYADPGQAALLLAERTNVDIRVRWAETGDLAKMKMITARVATITHEATPAPGELQTITFELRSASLPSSLNLSQDGSVSDVRNTIVDANIVHFGFPKGAVSLSGGNVTSVPDVRGPTAGPALAVVGVPPFDGLTVNLDGVAMRLQSALLALLRHDPTQHYALVFYLTVPTGDFGVAGVATDDGTTADFANTELISGGPPNITGGFPGLDSKVPTSETLRLAVMQYLKPANVPVVEDSHTGTGILTFEVWGQPRQVAFNQNPNSATSRITIGGWIGQASFHRTKYGASLAIRKALLLTDLHALQRFAMAQGVATQYTAGRPSVFMAIGDSIQAGGYITSSPNAPNSYVDLLAADAALNTYAYTRRAFSGIQGIEQAGLFDTVHGPDFRPLQWAKTLVVIGLGTNDRFHAITSAAWIAALDAMCTKILNLHPAAKIIVGTTPDTGFWQEATDAWLQAVNTHVRGMIAAGKAHAVLDFQTIAGWNPVGTPANFVESAGQGVHPVQSLQNAVKAALLTLAAPLL